MATLCSPAASFPSFGSLGGLPVATHLHTKAPASSAAAASTAAGPINPAPTATATAGGAVTFQIGSSCSSDSGDSSSDYQNPSDYLPHASAGTPLSSPLSLAAEPFPTAFPSLDSLSHFVSTEWPLPLIPTSIFAPPPPCKGPAPALHHGKAAASAPSLPTLAGQSVMRATPSVSWPASLAAQPPQGPRGRERAYAAAYGPAAPAGGPPQHHAPHGRNYQQHHQQHHAHQRSSHSHASHYPSHHHHHQPAAPAPAPAAPRHYNSGHHQHRRSAEHYHAAKPLHQRDPWSSAGASSSATPTMLSPPAFDLQAMAHPFAPLPDYLEGIFSATPTPLASPTATTLSAAAAPFEPAVSRPSAVATGPAHAYATSNSSRRGSGSRTAAAAAPQSSRRHHHEEENEEEDNEEHGEDDGEDVADGMELLRSYLYHKYLRFRDRALAERRQQGPGRSPLVSSLYKFWLERLQHKFNRQMYQTFKETAMEDSALGRSREGMETLYLFLRRSLLSLYRERVFRDFIYLVGAELHQDSFGLEQLWHFLRERNEDVRLRSELTVRRRIYSRPDMVAALRQLDRYWFE